MPSFLCRFVVFLVLFCFFSVFAQERQEADIIRQLYNHATQIPLSTVKVRAMVRLTEPPWTKEQINNEVKAQMARISSGKLENQFQIISNKVASAHSGERWVLFQETKVPNFYRLDLKDYFDVEPVIDDGVTHSNKIFDAYHINNYGRTEPKYAESHAFKGQIIIDNSLTPVVWEQENLFVAKYLEGRAAGPLVFLLAKKVDIAERQILLNQVSPENKDLFPPLPIDEDKLNDLLNDKITGFSLRVNPMNVSNVWSVELLSSNLSVKWTVNENLPYLVSKVTINANGNEYISERSGLSDLGFPSLWQIEQHDAGGKATTKQIHILSVTTNVDLSVSLATNYPTGFQVWERFGNGEMRPISGVTNRLIANQGLISSTSSSNTFIIRAIMLTVFLLPPLIMIFTAIKKRIFK